MNLKTILLINTKITCLAMDNFHFYGRFFPSVDTSEKFDWDLNPHNEIQNENSQENL